MYIINKTDGSIAATVNEGVVNTTDTSLALIGKNYTIYGELIAENFVKLLENFSNSQAPTTPLTGQLWYDTSKQQLQVYNGTLFKPVNPTRISASSPIQPAEGEFWYDSTNKQLKFYSDTSWKLIGPFYSDSQGQSGFELGTILDNTLTNRLANFLYHDDLLIGIISKFDFTPNTTILGFGEIRAGINLRAGTLLNGNVTNSEMLAGLFPSQFVRSDINSQIDGYLAIVNNEGLYVGNSDEFNIGVDGTEVYLSCDTVGNDLAIYTNNGAGSAIAQLIYANGSVTFTQDITSNGLTSTADAEFNGNVVIDNDLTVNGNTDITGNVSAENLFVNANIDAYIINATDLVAGSAAITAINTNGINSTGNFILGGTNSISFTSIGSSSRLYGNNGKIGLATQNTTRLEIDEVGTSTFYDNVEAPFIYSQTFETDELGIYNRTIDADDDITIQAAGLSRVNISRLTSGDAIFTDVVYAGSHVTVAGSLGVGTLASGFSGQIRASGSITSFYSDGRLKENITPISNALEKVNSISGVTFNINQKAKDFGFNDIEEQVGVIAQEVEKVLPQVVKLAPFDSEFVDGVEKSISGENYKTVQYEKLVPLLIQAINELSQKVNNLEQQVKK